MRLWSRGAAINLGCAVVFAGWCWLWLWLLFEATVPYPGIFTLTGDRGAYELPELMTGRPARVVFVAFYLFALLPPLLLGMARGWLDPDGEGTRALRWSFGSWRLDATAAAAFLLILAAALFPEPGDEIMAVSIAGFAALLGATAPFFAWNALTLSKPTLDGWWVPRWPGWRALLWALALFAISTAIGLGVGVFASIHRSASLILPLWAAEWLAHVLLGLAAAAIWLKRGRFGAIRSDLSRVLRWRVLGPSLWQNLWLGLSLMAWVWPFLAAAMLAIFVIPQYEEVASSRGEGLPVLLRTIASIGRASGIFIMAAVPAAVFVLLAQGRLLVRRGLGP